MAPAPKSPPIPPAKGRTILILRTERVILFELYFSSPVKCRKEIFRRGNQFDSEVSMCNFLEVLP